MKRKKSYFPLWILGLFLLSYTAMAVEVVIGTGATTAESVKQKGTKKAEKAQTTATPVSIDALVAAYQQAPESEAYKIMNQIKQQIALMTQKRQAHAIDKVHQAVDQKGNIQNSKSKKKRKHVRKQKKQIKKKYKKHVKKRKKELKRKTHGKNYTASHPDPMSVLNGISEQAESSSIGDSIGGGMGDSMGGGIGGDGGMGGGMGGF